MSPSLGTFEGLIVRIVPARRCTKSVNARAMPLTGARKLRGGSAREAQRHKPRAKGAGSGVYDGPHGRTPRRERKYVSSNNKFQSWLDGDRDARLAEQAAFEASGAADVSEADFSKLLTTVSELRGEATQRFVSAMRSRRPD
ncbi:hypothetical protein WG922_17790 [Ramlibacter sp. AN1015]|uniref:hypothetical protein n=1 Tax=Ramlibacter sp. AN1015 TaxID=3133428 RepID=UPI0030BBBE78